MAYEPAINKFDPWQSGQPFSSRQRNQQFWTGLRPHRSNFSNRPVEFLGGCQSLGGVPSGDAGIAYTSAEGYEDNLLSVGLPANTWFNLRIEYDPVTGVVRRFRDGVQLAWFK